MSTPEEMADTACLDGESDTESFVDALEDLQLTEEKPVEFAQTREKSDHLTSEYSSTESDIHREYTMDSPSSVNLNDKLSESNKAESGKCSSLEEEDNKQIIDDMIKEATSDMATPPSETPGECCEEDNEDDAEEAARKEMEEAMTEDEREVS